MLSEQHPEERRGSLARIAGRHIWKLALIPLFFDTGTAVKLVCAMVLAFSLIWDVARIVSSSSSGRNDPNSGR